MRDMGARSASVLVEADPGDAAGDVGAELHAELVGTGVDGLGRPRRPPKIVHGQSKVGSGDRRERPGVGGAERVAGGVLDRCRDRGGVDRAVTRSPSGRASPSCRCRSPRPGHRSPSPAARRVKVEVVIVAGSIGSSKVTVTFVDTGTAVAPDTGLRPVMPGGSVSADASVRRGSPTQRRGRRAGGGRRRDPVLQIATRTRRCPHPARSAANASRSRPGSASRRSGPRVEARAATGRRRRRTGRPSPRRCCRRSWIRDRNVPGVAYGVIRIQSTTSGRPPVL